MQSKKRTVGGRKRLKCVVEREMLRDIEFFWAVTLYDSDTEVLSQPNSNASSLKRQNLEEFIIVFNEGEVFKRQE